MEDVLIQHSQESSMLGMPQQGSSPKQYGRSNLLPTSLEAAEGSDSGCQQHVSGH